MRFRGAFRANSKYFKPTGGASRRKSAKRFVPPKSWRQFTVTQVVDALCELPNEFSFDTFAATNTAFFSDVAQHVRLTSITIDCVAAGGVTGVIAAQIGKTTPVATPMGLTTDAKEGDIRRVMRLSIPKALLTSGTSPTMLGSAFIGLKTLAVKWICKTNYSLTLRVKLHGYFSPQSPLVLNAGECKSWKAPLAINYQVPCPAQVARDTQAALLEVLRNRL